MPFVFDQTEIEWPDDESDPPPPRADQFVYLPAPEYGGQHEPVRFSLDVPPEPPAPESVPFPRPSLWNRLRGRKPSAAQRAPAVAALHDARAAHAAFVRQRLLAAAVPALGELGVRQIYCRYDGGNDEGFAWLDSATLRDGTRIDREVLVEQLVAHKLLDRLIARGVTRRYDAMSEHKQVASFMHDWLCTEFAVMLLGSGYGTGEHVLYGAFTVDFDAGTVVDDPGADPVTRNREIAR
ncbi:hypothetical protein CK489_37380 [Bradyrhizobium sp. UFLA03-84]|uniref:hypothetical protein n=1 Tax=Bradyrhizobium sp. UFLA03-84 TaxID=418599 RepID=UPI000BAE19F3|nr:hypothetical protein [Bradyrhizobium sp. UFLA03-84]PAY03958.1 hypothetical protein CK489_37380 [Bradyrhizobium sp. UFLA03-84]